MQGDTPYDKLSLDLLVGFYYQINLNIKKGILSQVMYHEIKLIKQTANKRGIYLDYMYDKGSLIVKVEAK
ncbi:hypothetical protein [Peribacillus loiseleuriae]|uniref:hypothetical protein n=1 Tax=Peribacillus loiseleuriae TaxID=1679170 RepID=UPI003D016391